MIYTHDCPAPSQRQFPVPTGVPINQVSLFRVRAYYFIGKSTYSTHLWFVAPHELAGTESLRLYYEPVLDAWALNYSDNDDAWPIDVVCKAGVPYPRFCDSPDCSAWGWSKVVRDLPSYAAQAIHSAVFVSHLGHHQVGDDQGIIHRLVHLIHLLPKEMEEMRKTNTKTTSKYPSWARQDWEWIQKNLYHLYKHTPGVMWYSDLLPAQEEAILSYFKNKA